MATRRKKAPQMTGNTLFGSRENTKAWKQVRAKAAKVHSKANTPSLARFNALHPRKANGKFKNK
jgi:hypothetical protein